MYRVDSIRILHVSLFPCVAFDSFVSVVFKDLIPYPNDMDFYLYL